MKLAEVAEKLGCRLEGPPELEIRGVSGIEHAERVRYVPCESAVLPLLKTRAFGGSGRRRNYAGSEAALRHSQRCVW